MLIQMKIYRHIALLFLLIIAVIQVRPADAAVCARVKIEIIQELTFERIAFDARLAITNDLPDQPLENLSVRLDITDENGDDASSQFFVRVLSMDKINAVDGTGTIPPQVKSEVHWMLIPSPGAGGILQTGKQYFVGGVVEFTAAGNPQNMSLLPDMITVKPQPELVLDYFLPREVWADDPFTDPVEAPIPFSLGVRVKNYGYGPAPALAISSGQPKIVENKQGLLIDFRLLGSAVNDKPVAPTLNLSMGNIEPQKCSTGRWEMVTTLSGKFVEFNASYTHASELGGLMTSLIKEVNTRFLTHEVLVDLPGSDLIRDYLAYTDPLGSRMPETIYTSDCLELPVNAAQGTVTGYPQPGSPTVSLDITPITGWSYTKVLDPANGNLPLVEVIRSDSKRINPNNVWVSEEKPTGKQSDPSAFYFNILDHDTTGRYFITYTTPAADTIPPVTNIVIEEPKYGQDPVFVTSLTNFIFTATDDNSGVSAMVFNLDGRGEEPAFPFNLERLLPGVSPEGSHSITFYSTDRSGNREVAKGVDVYADDSSPVIVNFTATPSTITPSAPDGVNIVREASLSIIASDATGVADIRYDIASGTASNDSEFNTLSVIRTITGNAGSGVELILPWNGLNGAGNIVPAGQYTIRLTASDPLGHQVTAFRVINVNEFLTARALASAGADQMYPSISGQRVVWQDFRNSKWDIYLHDITAVSLLNLTENKLADQTRPSIDGDYIVWQDRSDGNWDIVMYNLADDTETKLTSTLADETKAVVKGNWIAWQGKAGGNEDIYIYNIGTQQTEQITFDTRDQINPVIDGNKVVWEDYRHGLGEIYEYDLISRVEKRITDNTYNQTRPSAINGRIVWVDQRDGNRELYLSYMNKEQRLTNTGSDDAQPFADGINSVYVDYASGLSDPNLSLINLVSRRAMRLISDPNRQEEPELSGNRLVWQDNRSGLWQIYFTEVILPPVPVLYKVKEGLSVIAVTKGMKESYANAFSLLNAWKGQFNVKSILVFEPMTGEMLQADMDGSGVTSGTNFTLTENMALMVYSDSSAEVDLGGMPECVSLNFNTGFNLISVPCVPDNYTAFMMIQSMGVDRTISIARYDNTTGRWDTAAVLGGEVVGKDFLIMSGEGYIVYTSGDILNWYP